MTCAEASGCGCCEANMAAGATIGPATAAAPWKINSLRFRTVHLFQPVAENRLWRYTNSIAGNSIPDNPKLNFIHREQRAL
jgi:hypothetical protein